jgi:hypothetical protein
MLSAVLKLCVIRIFCGENQPLILCFSCTNVKGSLLRIVCKECSLTSVYVALFFICTGMLHCALQVLNVPCFDAFFYMYSSFISDQRFSTFQ